MGLSSNAKEKKEKYCKTASVLPEPTQNAVVFNAVYGSFTAQWKTLTGGRPDARILLYDFKIIGRYLRYNGHMAVWIAVCSAVYQQIARLRFASARISVLKQIAPDIKCAVFQVWVKKAYGMSVAVGHFVFVILIIVAFYKFHALVFEAQIVTVGA